jgi:hypothetical protein
VKFEFESKVIEWRGPAPFYFATTPDSVTREIKTNTGHLSYGWGCIPVDITVGNTTLYTALFPREGTYYIPLKVALRKAEVIEVGDFLTITVEVKG